MSTRYRRIFGLALLAGSILLLIGIRFLVVPESAAKTFGLTPAMNGSELHYIIGLRDVWLGALALAFAVFAEWRALALWLLFAVPVCWGDAAIVASSGGPALAVGFHLGSGVFCLVLGLAAWNMHGRLAPEQS